MTSDDFGAPGLVLSGIGGIGTFVFSLVAAAGTTVNIQLFGAVMAGFLGATLLAGVILLGVSFGRKD